MGRGETNAKKRKRQAEAKAALNSASDTIPEEPVATKKVALSISSATEDATTKSATVFQPLKGGRDWTVSVALPGNILNRGESPELQNSLAGQIARALSVFCIDEVIVFEDAPAQQPHNGHDRKGSDSDPEQADAHENGYPGRPSPDDLLIILLTYLEAPPYLRKYLFSNIPQVADLESVGKLPKLDLPHHLESSEWCVYREGVTLPDQHEGGTLIEAGLGMPVLVKIQTPLLVPKNTRVTLKFGPDAKRELKEKVIIADAIHPDMPREEGGYYWGYNVRKAESFSNIFTESPYKGGYDMTIGTSERGVDIETLYSGNEQQRVKNFKHLLIVFGGELGLEVAVQKDKEFERLGVEDSKDVFDRWVNILPGQGSRNIQTEEALWIGLSGLRRIIVNNK